MIFRTLPASIFTDRFLVRQSLIFRASFDRGKRELDRVFLRSDALEKNDQTSGTLP